MIDTILFDLDGTLLPMHTEKFTERYFKELSEKLKDYFTAEEVTKYMWNATEYMINREEREKTNKEAFFEDFYKNVTHKEEILTPMLEDFYESDFNKVQEISEVSDEIVKAVEVLKQKGYNLVVASNPLFPKTAMINRIKWAGLDEEDFMFITSFEEMHFSKPNLNFYKEILLIINKEPKDCLMVGNDIEEDMVVSKLGIKTYLINNFVRGDIDKSEYIDYIGDYSDFYKFVKNLPRLSK